MSKRVSGLLVCTFGLLGVGGCAFEGARPMTAALFVPANTSYSNDLPLEPSQGTVASVRLAPGNSPLESPTKASILPSQDSAAPASGIKPLDALPAQPTTLPTELSGGDASPAVVPGPAVNAAPPADEPGADQRVYMTLGGVVAVVNATPIYANQVLSPLKREFAVKSKEMDEKAFKRFAMQEIGRQFEELVEDELYFATAYHGLTDEDRKLAQMIAVQVRDERVTAAGGSVEQARRKALLEEGDDFDTSMQKEYRRIVHSLYQRRRIDPMIQVSADGMREYYRLNCAKLYGDKDKAQFRVIKIDPDAAGGMEPATAKINALREKALHGADFGALASADNDDSYLKGRGGNPTDPGEWIERNTYPNDAIEAALWQIEPGQITPVIQANHALYIAKLDARHLGITKSFEDQKVQDDIYNKLRQSQLADLSQKSKEDSLGNGMVETDEDRMQIALDMAMQGYAQVAR